MCATCAQVPAKARRRFGSSEAGVIVSNEPLDLGVRSLGRWTRLSKKASQSWAREQGSGQHSS